MNDLSTAPEAGIRGGSLGLLLIVSLGVGTAPEAGAQVCSGGSVELISQLQDYSNGFKSDATSNAQIVADQLVVAQNIGLSSVTVWGGFGPGNTPSNDFTLIVHDDSAGLPGGVIYTESGIAATVVATGVVFPPPLVPLDEYEVTLTPAAAVTLPAGVLWLEIYNDAAGGDAWFWLTAPLDPQNGIAGSGVAFVAPGGPWFNLNPDMAMVVCGGIVEPGTQYCAGDGLGTPCPCGNNNDGSMGGCDWGDPLFPEGGVLTASGSDSIAANDTLLVATGVSNDFGIFFGASNAVNGGAGNPLNDGLRCAGGGLVRLTAPTIAAGNQAITPSPVQTLDVAAASGVTRRYQYWFRTPTGPCGQQANLTNGYEIVWLP